MAMNAFEGGRRIAKLVAALWILGWIVAAIFFTPAPYISLNYVIAGSGQAPMRSEEGACNDDGKESIIVRTRKGTEAWATLCFRSEKIIDGTRYYRFSVDRLGRWTLPEVMAYTAQVKKNFVIPQADEEWIESRWWVEYLTDFGRGALVAIGGLVFLWVFSWAFGWIVRGFLDIPRGQDARPKKVSDD